MNSEYAKEYTNEYTGVIEEDLKRRLKKYELYAGMGAGDQAGLVLVVLIRGLKFWRFEYPDHTPAFEVVESVVLEMTFSPHV
jgi:hypothetical protein